MYDFQQVIPRKNTNSMKWDKLIEGYKRDDLLPMWVADMDFLVSHHITEAISKKLKNPVFGYTFCSDDYYNAVVNWMKKRHNWDIKREWIIFTPGVVPALSYAIRAYSEIGDNVVIQTSVYHLFKQTIINNQRNVITNPLKYENGTYIMDFEDLEKKIDSKTKLLILCSPHNPVGRVWTVEELLKLSEICLKNNIKIISDEIHFDLIYKDYKHTVLSTISNEIKENSIICTAPSKTFNLAGMQVSNIIIPNKEMRDKYNWQLEIDHIGKPNSFGEAALIAAYNDSEQWLDSLIAYIEQTKDYFIDYIEKHIPQLKVVNPEGTYLLWVDCSELGMNSQELKDFFINECKLALNHGQMFGEEGDSFQRFNIACSRTLVQEALDRMNQAIKNKKMGE